MKNLFECGLIVRLAFLVTDGPDFEPIAQRVINRGSFRYPQAPNLWGLWRNQFALCKNIQNFLQKVEIYLNNRPSSWCGLFFDWKIQGVTSRIIRVWFIILSSFHSVRICDSVDYRFQVISIFLKYKNHNSMVSRFIEPAWSLFGASLQKYKWVVTCKFLTKFE